MSKLYVLVRGDLTLSQQAVQACHAVAEFVRYANDMPCMCGSCNDKYWDNGVLVLLRVRDQEELHAWKNKVIELKAPYEIFYEPDVLSDTAMACFDVRGDLKKTFKHLPLL